MSTQIHPFPLVSSPPPPSRYLRSIFVLSRAVKQLRFRVSAHIYTPTIGGRWTPLACRDNRGSKRKSSALYFTLFFLFRCRLTDETQEMTLIDYLLQYQFSSGIEYRNSFHNRPASFLPAQVNEGWRWHYAITSSLIAGDSSDYAHAVIISRCTNLIESLEEVRGRRQWNCSSSPWSSEALNNWR